MLNTKTNKIKFRSTLQHIFYCFILGTRKHVMNRRLKLEEAVQFVYTPGSDSEFSDFSSDEEDKDEMKDQFINPIIG